MRYSRSARRNSGEQRRAVRGTLVALVAVAGTAGVVAPPAALGVGTARDESEVGEVVDVVADEERRRAAIARLEEGRDRRHRSVVEIRRAQPEAVERLVRVALRLAEVREPRRIALRAQRAIRRVVSRRFADVLGVGAALLVAGVRRCAGVEQVLGACELWRVGVEPRAIGADLVDRRHLAERRGLRIAERRGGRAVTAMAVLPVNRRALSGQRGVDPVLGELRRLRGPEPVGDARQVRRVDGRRRRARAEAGAQVPLVHRAVVAVPVQRHALARALMPHRRKIRDADGLMRAGAIHREAKQRLRRIERVDAAGSPAREIEKAQLPHQGEQLVAHRRDAGKLEDRLIDQAQSRRPVPAGRRHRSRLADRPSARWPASCAPIENDDRAPSGAGTRRRRRSPGCSTACPARSASAHPAPGGPIPVWQTEHVK